MEKEDTAAGISVLLGGNRIRSGTAPRETESDTRERGWRVGGGDRTGEGVGGGPQKEKVKWFLQ